MVLTRVRKAEEVWERSFFTRAASRHSDVSAIEEREERGIVSFLDSAQEDKPPSASRREKC
jgi:hypothetical protein